MLNCTGFGFQQTEDDLRILVLAGKEIDDLVLGNILHGMDADVARYASVSRGVRRLENSDADLVMIAPDIDDTTWLRALRRINDEYARWTLFLGSDEAQETEALDAGAFDAFTLKSVTPECLPRCMRNLKRQISLEKKLSKQRILLDWMEKTGRFGTWEMEIGEKPLWSKGLRHILGDDKRLTDDFSTVRQFVHPDDLEIYDQANKATFEQGWPLDFEYRAKLADGAIRHLHLHRRVDLGRDGKVVRAYGMTRDVTPEREFENYLFKRDAILQVVGRFAEKFLRVPDWEAGIDDALESLGKVADVSRTFIFRKHAGSDEEAPLSMIYEWHSPDSEPFIDRPEVQNQPFSPFFDRWRKTLSSRKVVAGVIKNFRSEEQKFFAMTNAKAIMLVPVFVGDRWWGFMGFTERREEREWQPAEIESMTMVADIFGSAILRSRMEAELKEANRSAEDAKTLALEASRAKSRFLANMSHEIRTPISGILGMAEMTITTGLTTEQREHMDMIRDAARALLAIVNDVLDISKIEAEKMELKPEDFEFRPSVERTVRPFKPEADLKRVLFRHTVDPEVPTHVHGDPDRLGQIIRNLVSNSIKFTDRGLIDLDVRVEQRDGDRICLRFTVTDTGEGIPEDKIATIFDSFTQVDSSVRKKHQGTGLGLTISKQLVEMMDGEIGVESTLGRGTTFSFSAWFGLAKAQVQDKLTPVPTPEALHANILMAEDNPLNQKFLTHFLSMFGHQVTVAGNGLEALKVLKEKGRAIDLILMDIQMPEMGGIETTGVIRESDGKLYDAGIPIIALTAYAMKGDKERMFEAGMDDYVSKPIDMKELSAAIARNVARKQMPKPGHPTAPAKGVKVAPSVGLDMDSLIDRFDGNMELLKEILALFLEEADQKLANLDEALSEGDLTELGAALHSITNISSHVLAMEIVEQSRGLERKCYRDTLEAVTPGVQSIRPKFVALIAEVRKRAATL